MTTDLNSRCKDQNVACKNNVAGLSDLLYLYLLEAKGRRATVVLASGEPVLTPPPTTKLADVSAEALLEIFPEHRLFGMFRFKPDPTQVCDEGQVNAEKI